MTDFAKTVTPSLFSVWRITYTGAAKLFGENFPTMIHLIAIKLWISRFCTRVRAPHNMTTGIIIAAGRGVRMGSLTDHMPKCMLPVAGRPLLHHTIDRLKDAGCNKIVVIVGYKSKAISAQDCVMVENSEYGTNNILHSLMHARDYLLDDVICSYSDIWLEPEILWKLCESPGEIVASVDTDWEPYYDGRSDHPLTEAENVFLNGENVICRIGKHLRPEKADSFSCGEFIGLWRMDKIGTRKFVTLFEELDKVLKPFTPFQNSATWQMAYITDIFQEMIDRGDRISSSLTRRQWAEFDTRQDIERLPHIAELQQLRSLTR